MSARFIQSATADYGAAVVERWSTAHYRLPSRGMRRCAVDVVQTADWLDGAGDGGETS